MWLVRGKVLLMVGVEGFLGIGFSGGCLLRVRFKMLFVVFLFGCWWFGIVKIEFFYMLRVR